MSCKFEQEQRQGDKLNKILTIYVWYIIRIRYVRNNTHLLVALQMGYVSLISMVDKEKQESTVQITSTTVMFSTISSVNTVKFLSVFSALLCSINETREDKGCKLDTLPRLRCHSAAREDLKYSV